MAWDQKQSICFFLCLLIMGEKLTNIIKIIVQLLKEHF